jgi:hypothetical protein
VLSETIVRRLSPSRKAKSKRLVKRERGERRRGVDKGPTETICACFQERSAVIERCSRSNVAGAPFKMTSGVANDSLPYCGK